MADPYLTPTFLAVLVISAFALPLFFLAWIRNTERLRHNREPWFAVLRSFSGGAVLSVIIAILFSLVLLNIFQRVEPLYQVLSRFANPETIVAVLIVAPFVEEAAKGLGVRSGRAYTEDRVDGLVYGAAAGLGFSATENLFYGLAVISEVGASGSLVLIAVRSFSSSFLHASATAVLGYGLATSWLGHRAVLAVPFYLVAVLMHGTFNFLASLGEIYAPVYGDWSSLLGFGAAAVFAIVAITVVRLKLAGPRANVAG